VATKESASPERVDAFLAAALPKVGVTELMGQDEHDGTVRSSYRTPPGADPMDTARRLRSLAEAEAIELYVSPDDGLDAQIRAYAGARLRHRIVLYPTLPETPPVALPRSFRRRPFVALVVAGLGPSAARSVVEADVPLTLAIRPYTPFALRTAEDASAKWQEVLVHLSAPSHGDTAEPTGLTRSIAAVPHATGVLVDGPPGPRLADADADLVVYPARFSPDRAPADLVLVPAQRSGRAGALETLARTCHLAVRDGVATMVVDAGDPELPAVLDWASRAPSQGYRMVLASEAVRATEIRGVEWEEVRTR
jgi:hypothetical protein